MARVKQTSTKGAYYNPFPTRLRELMEKRKPEVTQVILAKAIGVTRQAISQWKDGATAPDIYSLGKMADYFKVSTDYLICRTDIKSPDIDIRGIYEKTGLSDKSIGELYKFMQEEDKSVIDCLNQLIEDDNFYLVLMDMGELRRDLLNKAIYLNKKQKQQNPSNLHETFWLHRSRLLGESVTLNPAEFYDFSERRFEKSIMELIRNIIKEDIKGIDQNSYRRVMKSVVKYDMSSEEFELFEKNRMILKNRIPKKMTLIKRCYSKNHITPMLLGMYFPKYSE